MGVDFVHPEAFLLAIPAAALFLRMRSRRLVPFLLQAAIVVLLLSLAAQPRLRLREKGADVIAVVDRSLSMPADSARPIEEMLGLMAKGRKPGCRMGLVTFGEGARIQMSPTETGAYSRDSRETPPHASNLAEGMEMALALVPEDRPGRFVVLSDGEYTGLSPLSAAREAASRGIASDFRLFARPTQTDVAVERIVLPPTVNSGEPFQFSAVIRAEAPAAADYTLMRGDHVVARGRGQFVPGSNRLVFRDILSGRGVCQYDLRVNSPNDPVPENNVGSGVIEVLNSPALLVVNASGHEDVFVRALRKAGVPAQVVAEDLASLRLGTLQGYRGVALENVPASKIGRQGMIALAHFVESLGGGLLVTGGQRSFANGGYLRSPLDPVLPVSMEIRQERRKVGIALAISLDRSGSMQAPVAGGLRKMDLANLGTIAAIEVLSPLDSVAVIAVDSAPHVIVPLSPCDNPGAHAPAIKRIESMGGGIFVYEALLAAGKQIERAEQATRHIILFADAADSEQPGNYQELIEQFRRMNITVSVIGLGTEKDCDAGLLKDIAKRGEGQAFFTQDAHDLPRVFAQDTVTVTRSTFVDKAAAVKMLPGLVMVTGTRLPDMPEVGGYNVTRLRERATAGIAIADEDEAPGLAFWQFGLGRAAVFTPEVDGPYTGRMAGWKHYGDFLTTLGRFLLGDEKPQSVQAAMGLVGSEGVVSVDIDPENLPREMSNPIAAVVPPSSGGDAAAPLKLPLQWISPTRLEARFSANAVGCYQAAVQLGRSSVLRVNPVMVSYSPEYAPRADRMSGRETLRAIAEITGGRERLSAEGVYETPSTTAHMRRRDVSLPLAAVALILVVLEIAERRLSVLTMAGRRAMALASAAGSVAIRLITFAGRSRRQRRSPAKPGPPSPEEVVPACEGVPPRTSPEDPGKMGTDSHSTASMPADGVSPHLPPPSKKESLDQALKKVKSRRG